MSIFFNCSPLSQQQETALVAVKVTGITILAGVITAILVYSIATHAYMDKLMSDPALAALTKDRFFAILKIAGSIGLVAGVMAVWSHFRAACAD